MKHEYICKDCGCRFIVEIPFGETIYGINCPECKSNNVKKFYEKVAIIFKGRGFYSTDNRKEGEK